MAGPVAAFAADVQSRLRELKKLTDESAKMEKEIAGAVRDIDKLRTEAAKVASPQLAQPMAKALGSVRRAADAVQQHVHDKSQYTPHEYRIIAVHPYPPVEEGRRISQRLRSQEPTRPLHRVVL
jgi:hypothetical protein